MWNFSRQCAKLVKSTVFQTRLQQTLIKPKPQIGRQSNDISPVFLKAASFSDRTALRDTLGSYTYANLFLSAKELSKDIDAQLRGKGNQQVLFLCPNDANYVITQWAIWMSGHTAVPTSPMHPQSILEYYAKDSDSKLLITTPEYAELMNKVSITQNKSLYVLDDQLRQKATQKVTENQSDLEDNHPTYYYNRRNAMILYTSGTTASPKGVVLSHKNIVSQVQSLVDAWRWTSNDVILHVLPLHHVHGIVNALLCPLYVGAKCNMLPKYDSNTVWSWLLSVNTSPDDRKITVFMAVPTIYSKLIDEYNRVFSKDSKMTGYIKTMLKTKMRLMVSGSAPLTVPVYEKWFEITGHRLLERYGMTEIGMCLSQEYDSARKPGYVGVPLPGVAIRLGLPPEEDEGDYTTVLESTNIGTPLTKLNHSLNSKDDPIGEILVKGDSIFKEYYNKPEATENAFTIGKWFKTGDICQYSKKDKLFKLLGRSSVDIIKSGGYKVSALEVETKLLEHPDIFDCAIVGVRDETLGEAIGAVVVLKPEKEMTLRSLTVWAENKMPKYNVPKLLKIVKSIPKNAMGKVNKKELVLEVFP